MSNSTTCQTLEDYLTRSKEAITAFEVALEAAKESGDFTDVERWAREVEELKGQLRDIEILLPAHDSFELLKRFTELGYKVTNITVTDKSREGMLAGCLTLTDENTYPFIGNNIFTTIDGKQVEYAEKILSRPDGVLVGRVRLKDGIYYPFQGDTIIRTINIISL